MSAARTLIARCRFSCQLTPKFSGRTQGHEMSTACHGPAATTSYIYAGGRINCARLLSRIRQSQRASCRNNEKKCKVHRPIMRLLP